MRRLSFAVVLVSALALSGCGEGPVTLSQLQSAVRAHPDSVKWRVALAEAYLEQDMVHDAYIQFQRAVELDNTSFDAALGLARVQLELGDNVKAMKSANLAVALDGKSAEAMALQGKIHLASLDFDRAIERFRRAIQVDPANETAWTNLPLAYVRSDRLDEALASGKQAVAALPESMQARLNLALARALGGDAAGAETDLRAARKLDPNNAEPPLRLAEVLLQQGRNFQEAYELAEESAAIDPRDGAAYALQAMALDRMGETNRAVLELKRHVQIHHHNLRLWLLLATLAQRNGDMETAQLAAAMAVRIGPRPPDKMPSEPPAGSEATPDSSGSD